MRAAVLALGAILLFTWISADAARAEFFFDLYVGGNVTGDTEGTIKIGPAGGLPKITASGPVDFKVGPSAGFRGAYWFDLGVHVVAGVKFHVWSWSEAQPSLSGSLAIFVEYGFTHFKPSDYEDNIGGVPVELRIDRLDTHHGVAGVGFHF